MPSEHPEARALISRAVYDWLEENTAFASTHEDGSFLIDYDFGFEDADLIADAVLEALARADKQG